eukprot:gene10844-1022_t
MRRHSSGLQQGRPDLNFGDPTGSPHFYQRCADVARRLHNFARDR